MKDYSENMAGLPRKVSRLSDCLEQKKYLEASVLALGIAKGMMEVVMFCHKEIDK